jgi:hypothetical protein
MAYSTRWRASVTIEISSMRTSFEPALSVPMVTLFGQAF